MTSEIFKCLWALLLVNIKDGEGKRNVKLSIYEYITALLAPFGMKLKVIL